MNTTKWFARIPGSPRLWLMLFFAFALLYGFFETVDDVFSDPLEADYDSHILDTNVAKFFQQFRTTRLTQVAMDLTALGSVSVLFVLTILGLTFLALKKDVIGCMHMTLALAGAGLWPHFLKPYFGRDRPDLVDRLVEVGHYSFPSGHSFGSAAAYATFAFFCARYMRQMRAEVVCYVYALLVVSVVGITRIYLGVHYATDVMGGVCAGGAWSFLLASGFSVLYSRQNETSALSPAQSEKS